jgi:hypothetical protein
LLVRDGSGDGPLIYIVAMPMILLHTVFRVVALWTCRDPVWPKAVEDVSGIDSKDAYDQPSGNTPTGWAETAMARYWNEWPLDPKRAIAEWDGERDPAKNALLWAEEMPPQMN